MNKNIKLVIELTALILMFIIIIATLFWANDSLKILRICEMYENSECEYFNDSEIYICFKDVETYRDHTKYTEVMVNEDFMHETCGEMEK